MASNDDIQQLVGITGCDPETAARYLKAKNNNLEAAVGAYFDQEDISQWEKQNTTWDESGFSADREGNNASGRPDYSYNEANLRPLGRSAAPTRGNSPVPSLRQPATQNEADAELEQALAASRQDLRYEGQETGVIGAVGPNMAFGPATRDDYDPSKWGMVTATRPLDSHEASEIIPDLDSADRRHQEGEPRFLKHLPSGDYTPNLLTIAHSIPLAREALLARSAVRPNYGDDSNWWNGHEIVMPKIVHTADLSLAEPAPSQGEEIVSEMQRLMALLDASHRSYGSADLLVKMAEGVERSGVLSETTLDWVLQTWEAAAEKAEPGEWGKHGIFHSLVGTSNPEGMRSPHMRSIPLDVTLEGPTSEDSTMHLYEVIDHTLWDTDPDEAGFTDNYIEHCADILLMRLNQSTVGKSKLGVEVPPTLYVDKYLRENIDHTKNVRKQMVETKGRIATMDTIQSNLKSFQTLSSQKLIDTTSLLEHAIGHFSGARRKRVLVEKEENGIDVDFDDSEPQPHHDAIAEKLRAVYDSVQSKLQLLEEGKAKARDLLTRLSKEDPPDLPEPLKHRYTLRGVSTKPNVTYVLRPRSENDEGMAIDGDDAPPGMQWWRIDYDVSASGARVIKTKLPQYEVIQAVEVESNSALLVYASDAALNFEANPELPEPLQEFIRADNEHFESELTHLDAGRAVGGNVRASPEPEPRLSIESTAVNLDDEDLDPPGYYSLDGTYAPQATGVEYAGMAGVSPPAHEIRINTPDEVLVGREETIEPEGKGVEMVEKAGDGLLSQMQGVEIPRRGSDDTMADVEMLEKMEDEKRKVE